MAINGQIVDEINGLIASRDSIRTTMKAAGIASDTSKLSDLATNLANAKYEPPTKITVTDKQSTLSLSGKLCTGNITIPAVNYFYTSPEIPTSTSGYNDGDIWLVVNS